MGDFILSNFLGEFTVSKERAKKLFMSDLLVFKIQIEELQLEMELSLDPHYLPGAGIKALPKKVEQMIKDKSLAYYNILIRSKWGSAPEALHFTSGELFPTDKNELQDELSIWIDQNLLDELENYWQLVLG